MNPLVFDSAPILAANVPLNVAASVAPFARPSHGLLTNAPSASYPGRGAFGLLTPEEIAVRRAWRRRASRGSDVGLSGGRASSLTRAANARIARSRRLAVRLQRRGMSLVGGRQVSIYSSTLATGANATRPRRLQPVYRGVSFRVGGRVKHRRGSRRSRSRARRG